MENTNEERNVALNEEQKNNAILDQGIEQIQANGGMSEAAMEADIASESLDSFFYDETEDNNDSPSENEIEAAERAYQEWEEMLDDNQKAEEIIEKNQRKEPADVDVKTNYVIDKLSKAGIEVVTDKEEFDRILESQRILQKMQENNSVTELFISKNEENLNSEIDKLTINDIGLKDEYIEISKQTPFIFKEFGLNEYPVCMYKQKLARALFLEKEKFGERRTHGHKDEFTSKEVKEVFQNLGNPRYVFNSRRNIDVPDDFYLIGVYDQFDKNKNPMMVSFHFDKNKNEIEANWVTAVYGRNKIDIMKNWIDQGFLLYVNDTEIEKASEEVGTLYMRVMHSLNAHSDNIVRKSDFVNNMNILFYQKDNTTYGFAHNGKIYLNPDVMNSEAAVHEYTHLWDAYTQKTNPELWEKGLNIFKGTHYWEEVKSDPNYADISNDDNLVLSEIHSRICGKMAEKILEKIIEQDGQLTKDSVINWDKETWEYMKNELWFNVKDQFNSEDLKQFLSTPMKDLFQRELNLKIEQLKEKDVDVKTNYVIDMLSKAGIEVVTDKEEFDRILAREKLLQKMAKSKSEKYLNTEDIKLLKSWGYKKDDFEQIQLAMLVSDIKLNGKKTSVKKAVEVLGRKDFLSGISRSAFSWSSERINEDNTVSFDSEIIFNHSLPGEEYVRINNAAKEAKEHIEFLNELVRQESYFTFDEEDSRKFIEHIDEWRQNNTNPSKLIVVGKVTPVMKILGISEKLIEVEQATLDKMVRDNPLYPNDKQGHSLTVDDIYAIPSQLADPVMVFKSRTRDDSYVFFTERKDSENHSILIPLAVDKKKGRIVIHEITSMYGKDKEIDFVKTNVVENNLIYEDRKRSCLWAKEKVEELNELNRKDAEKKLSSNGERFTQIQFLGQRFTDNGTYTFNILTKERLVNFLSSQNTNVQNFIQNNTTYGFAHDGKIYLNPDVMNSEAAIHEYTHLWDAYTQKTNPELWEKGLNIFKGTSLWNEVLEDENYADIKDDENLVLSECHARICGKIADAVLQKVLERDGDLKKAEMIDWDMECSQYLFNELKQNNEQLRKEDFFEVVNFMATPMKDLFQRELKLKIEQIKENKVDNDYTPKYPAYMENRFVLEQNHPDGWAVGKNMWVIWDNLLQHSGRSGGFFNTEEGIAAGNKELNEIIDSVKKSETEALEKVYEGNGAYTCQLFSDYSGYGSTTTRHEMLFATAKENSHGSIIDAVGVLESEIGTIKGYARAFANRNNFAADSLLIAFNPTDKRKNANKQWTELSILAKEKNISFVYQDGETESRYAFALDYAHKHNLPCFLLDNEISRKIAQNVESVTFYKDYEDLINKVNAMAEEQTVSASVQKVDRQVSVEKEKSTNELNYHGLTLAKKDNNLIEPAYDVLLIKGIDDKTDSKLVEMLDNSAKWDQYCISNNSENFIPAIAAQIVSEKKEVQNENINKSFIKKVQELKEKVTKSLKKNVAVGIALTSIFSANPNLFAQTKTVVPASEQKIIKEAEKEKEELLKTYKNKSPEELLNLILAANEAKTAAKIEASREQDKNQVLEKENKELKVKNEKLDFYKEHYKTKSAVQESFYEEKKKTQDMYESLKRSSQEDHDILYKHAKIVVNGKERVCHTGLVNGFKNCVERLDNAVKLNNELVKENIELRNILNRSNQNERNGVSY